MLLKFNLYHKQKTFINVIKLFKLKDYCQNSNKFYLAITQNRSSSWGI